MLVSGQTILSKKPYTFHLNGETCCSVKRILCRGSGYNHFAKMMLYEQDNLFGQ